MATAAVSPAARSRSRPSRAAALPRAAPPLRAAPLRPSRSSRRRRRRHRSPLPRRFVSRVRGRLLLPVLLLRSRLFLPPPASASAADVPPPAPPAFEPRADPAPAFASLTILLAFFVVNRRVAAAVERRRDRERAEEDLRRAKVRSLDGSADFDEVSEFASALDAAREEEAKAREVLAFLGAEPRRVGRRSRRETNSEVVEERRVSREIERRRGGREGPGGRRRATRRRRGVFAAARGRFERRFERFFEPFEAEDARAPPGWMTAATGFALAILAWSAVGLAFSPDPALGPALTPEQIERQMEMR